MKSSLVCVPCARNTGNGKEASNQLLVAYVANSFLLVGFSTSYV